MLLLNIPSHRLAIRLVVLGLTFCTLTATGEWNSLNFQLASNANVTVAINDANGARVRNLFADLPFSKGTHTVEWDGRDDNGKRVDPGDYQWIGLQHQPVHAVYRGSFQYGTPPWSYGQTGGWTADHSAPSAIVRVGDRLLLGSPEAEWGHGLIAVDFEGSKQWGLRWLDKRAWCGADALAAVGERVFATSYVKEKAVWEVDPATGSNHLVFEAGDLPPDVADVNGLRLAGARATPEGGEVYLVDMLGAKPRTIICAVDKPGTRLRYVRTLAIRPFGLAWLPDGRCVGAFDKSLDVVDTSSGARTTLVGTGLSAPAYVLADAAGRLYVADQGATEVHRFMPEGQLPWHYLRLAEPASHQIKVFSSGGDLIAVIGKAGGQQVGAIDPTAFFMPSGMALDAAGRLWVTEFTVSPKRVSVWKLDFVNRDPASVAKLDKQFFGPCMYGGGAAMINPREPWRLLDTNYGVVWNVDLNTGSYRAESLPWRMMDPWKEHGERPDLPFAGKPGVGIEVEGRRFTACQGGYGHGSEARWSPFHFSATGPVMIGEYVRDAQGVEIFRPQAAIGNIRLWMRSRELNCRREEQWLAKSILEAARLLPDWPRYASQMKMKPDADDVPHVNHVRGSGDWIVHPWPREISGMIWVDQNGDARVQPREISFHAFDDADEVLLDSGLNVTICVPKRREQDGGVYRIPRTGFNAVGAPDYRWDKMQKLTDAVVDGQLVDPDGNLLGFGSLNRPDGSAIWTYPCDPKGARDLGRDKRMELRPGNMNRVSKIQGMVQGANGIGRMHLLNSTDGMDYLMSSEDGLFISRIFQPAVFAPGWDTISNAVPGIELEGYSLQEECFNGHFARAETSGQGFLAGHYYLLGLGRSAVVEVTGLDSVKPLSGGTVKLTAGQGFYGRDEVNDPALLGMPKATREMKPASGPLTAVRLVSGRDAFGGPPARWASSEVHAAWDPQRGLLFKWIVADDPTPFVNQERDWTQLFSTGDACELQIQSPTLGRCRYIFAMNGATQAVVRLRYDAEAGDQSVVYRSGVLTTTVPVVEKLDISYGVRRMKNGYVIQFTLPWSILGIEPKDGLSIPFEMGQGYSDAGGANTESREAWFTGVSGMVSDVPTEARPTDNWGRLELR